MSLAVLWDIVIGIEARGFIVGSALAYSLRKGFVMIRKPGKLPGKVISQEYQLEYGSDKMEIHADAFIPGTKVLVVDDLIATGGTVMSAIALVEKLGGATKMTNQDKCDLAASFQLAVKRHLLQKSKKIFAKKHTKDFAIVGGASANQYIRQAYQNLCQEYNKTLHTVPLKYCSDNAAMIGRYAIDAHNKALFTDPSQSQVTSTKKHKNGTML